METQGKVQIIKNGRTVQVFGQGLLSTQHGHLLVNGLRIGRMIPNIPIVTLSTPEMVTIRLEDTQILVEMPDAITGMQLYHFLRQSVQAGLLKAMKRCLSPTRRTRPRLVLESGVNTRRNKSKTKSEQSHLLPIHGQPDEERMVSVSDTRADTGDTSSTTRASSVRACSPTAGLPNFGNTCYFNAVVQALRATPQLSSIILSASSSEDAELFARCCRNLLQREHAIPHDSVAMCLSTVRSTVANRFPQFHGEDEQDAHELLLTWMQLIGEQFRPALPQVGMTRSIAAENFHNSIDEVIAFQIEISYQCQGCHMLTVTLEKFRDLALSLPDQPAPFNFTLQRLIAQYFATEPVQKQCTVCGHSTAQASKRLVKLPRVLILHLK